MNVLLMMQVYQGKRRQKLLALIWRSMQEWDPN